MQGGMVMRCSKCGMIISRNDFKCVNCGQIYEKDTSDDAKVIMGDPGEEHAAKLHQTSVHEPNYPLPAPPYLDFLPRNMYPLPVLNGSKKRLERWVKIMLWFWLLLVGAGLIVVTIQNIIELIKG